MKDIRTVVNVVIGVLESRERDENEKIVSLLKEGLSNEDARRARILRTIKALEDLTKE